jgi:putative ABC transport system permease protein
MQTLSLFAGLAVLIACLGLFGLASYSAEQRTKEIGIRKVMGATVPGLLYLFSKEFTLLVALGFLVSLPVIIIGAGKWLEAYASGYLTVS